MAGKFSASDKIDPRALIAIVSMAILEYESMSLSGRITKAAGNDAWLSVLIGGLYLFLTTYLLVRLMNRFPEENFFHYSGKVWGRPAAYLITFSYFIFWAAFLTVLWKNSMEINGTFFLPQSPYIILLAIMAMAAIWLVSYGITAVTRFFQFMFPFMVLPLLLVAVLSVRNIELRNFLPFLGAGLLPVLKGAITYAGAVQGLEILLFIGPFLSKPQKAVKPALIGIMIVTAVVFIEIVTAIGTLGVKSTQELIWPNLSALGVLEIPGLPAQRFDLLLSLSALVGGFTTICMTLYLLTYGVAQVFGITRRNAVIYAGAGLTALATYVIPNFAWTMEIRELLNDAALVLISLIPVGTLLIAIVRGKRGPKYEK